jgi:ribose transport system permease protein
MRSVTKTATASIVRRPYGPALWGDLFAVPPSWIGLAVLVVASWIFRPAILSPLLLLAILRQAASLGVASIGQSLVMRCRSIDLSIGGVVVAVVYVMTSAILPVPDWALVVLSLLLGALVGGFNALLVTQLRVSAVIVTLATSIVLTGAVVAVTQYRQPGEVPDLVRLMGSGRVGWMPVAVLIWLAILMPIAVALRTTVFGRYLDAVGANPVAAEISGLPHVTVVFLCHVASGLTSALAGLLLLGFVSVGSTDLGQDLALNSIAAVILGGVGFGSGQGRMMGPAVGAFMLTFLYSFLTSFGLAGAGEAMVQGGIIALAALIYALRNNRR